MTGRPRAARAASGISATTALDRQAALADLARSALLGTPRRPLLERASRLIQGALDAQTCGIYEYLPGGDQLFLRAAASAPDGSADSASAIVVPLGTSPPFGCVAARAREHAIFDEDDRRFVVLVADILTAALQRLVTAEDERLASLQDPLTGLPNRALILDHLNMALARSQRRPSTVAVLFLDLDRFKMINDTLGHQAGDHVLAAVAQRLRTALRPPDTIGRLGGDEFVAVCEDVGGEADAMALAERLATAVESPVHLGGREIRIRASVGVALSTSATTDPAFLLAEADGAMFWAKRRGHAVALFDQRMQIGVEAGERPCSRPLVARLVDLLDDIDIENRVDLRDIG